MRALSAVSLLALGAAALAADDASPHARLFRDLAAESEQVRDAAALGLERAEGLTEDQVRAALAAAGGFAKPRVLRRIAARGMKGLVPEVVAALADPAPSTSDAAARALVSLGEEATAAGLAGLAASKDPHAAATRLQLQALAGQSAVEKFLLGKRRRKGGTYEGRYDDAAKFGWVAQPVLLAMLLDVPLETQHLVLPEGVPPAAVEAAKHEAVRRIVQSKRRGYRTFAPLPIQVQPDELFEIAVQALGDVGDLDYIGDALTSVAAELERVDREAGWRLRPVEESLYQSIDELLFLRGRPSRLRRTVNDLADRVEFARNRAMGFSPAEAAAYLSRRLSEYGQALHKLRRYDDAAEVFAEVVKIDKKLTGKEPSIAGYNRACALARRGRLEEAIRQLQRSLDPNVSAGSEDLTREWVMEDGDLKPLRDDPAFAKRYEEIVKRRYGGP